MGTENAIMAAVCADGETILGNAACEPHIQDLCRFLVSLGARIEGIGSNVLHIEGVDRARPAASTGSARTTSRSRASSALGAVTGGEVVVEDVRARRPHFDRSRVPEARDRDGDHRLVRARSRRAGPARRRRSRRTDTQDRQRHLAGVPRRPHVDRGDGRDAGAGNDPDLREDVREPPLLRGQAGLDGRADHPLRPASCRRDRPGAASTANGSRARTSGPEWRWSLRRSRAEGTSTIGNIGQIDRGYERIDERLRALGASIERADF